MRGQKNRYEIELQRCDGNDLSKQEVESIAFLIVKWIIEHLSAQETAGKNFKMENADGLESKDS